MTALLTGLRSRIDAILSEGRGVDGSLGAQAQIRAIPAGAFRGTPDNCPLTDAQLGAESVDRAYAVTFLSSSDDPLTNRVLSSAQVRTVVVVLDVGYVYGQLAAFVHPWPGSTESASTVVWQASQRAISDAERIKRALCFFGLYQHSGDDPAIVSIARNGASQVVDLGAGRLSCRTLFDVMIQLDVTEDYDPPAAP